MVKNGFVQISILISLLVMVMAIPLATKLVQQSTDSRSKATTGTIHQQNTAAAENKSATGRAELTQTIANANATNAARNATAGAVTAGAKATDGAEATKTESRYATRAALELKTANANLTSAAVNRNATEVAVKAEITQQIANAYATNAARNATGVIEMTKTMANLNATKTVEKNRSATGIAELTQTIAKAYATNAARNATAGAKATAGVDKATSAPTSKSCPPGTHLWLGDCKATLNVTTAPTSAPTKPPISPNRPTQQVNPTVAPEPTMPLFSDACKSGFCIPLAEGIFEDLGSREAYEKYVRDSESANKPAMMVMGGIVGAGAAVVAAPVVANAALAASVYGSPVVANIVSKLPNWFLNLAEKANTVADVYDYVSVIPACAINGIGSGECDNAVQNAMVASQTNNLVPQTVSNKVDDVVNASNNKIKTIFSADNVDDILDPAEKQAFINYYDFKSIKELRETKVNNLVKNITGLNLDEPELPGVLVNDVRTVYQKYNLPSIELRDNNPYEYRRQLLEITKKNKVDVLTDSQTTFFDDVPQAGGVAFDGNKIAYVQKASIKAENNTITHELVHALQDQKYPSMPTEIMEYEAYMTEKIPTLLENSEPWQIKNTFSYMLGSINYWYEDKNLPIPQTFDDVFK